MAVRKKLKLKGRAVIFVTTTTNNWIPVFNNPTAADIVLDTLNTNLENFSAMILGFVIMPNHFHGLICMKNIAELSRFMQSFKIISSKRIKSDCPDWLVSRLIENKVYRLWKPRYDDQAIVSERQFKIKLDYIHTNPLRAGLVEKETDWNYSSAKDWLLGIKGRIPVETNFEWSI